MKNETTFTPGPWGQRFTHPSHVEEKGVLVVHWGEPKSHASVWRNYEDEQGRMCHRPICEVYLIGTDPTPEAIAEQQANACLIAAAPDLYAALMSTFAYITGLEHFGVKPEGVVEPDMDAIRAALAKAVQP